METNQTGGAALWAMQQALVQQRLLIAQVTDRQPLPQADPGPAPTAANRGVNVDCSV